MLKLLLLAAGCGLTAPSTEPQHPQPAVAATTIQQGAQDKARNARLLKTLRDWISLYRKGKVNLGNPMPIVGKPLIVKNEVVPPGQALEAISELEQVRKLSEWVSEIDSPAAAKVLLDLASTGLDHRVKYDAYMLPNVVRGYGVSALARLKNDEVKSWLLQAASGQSVKEPMQAAALLTIAAIQRPEHSTALLAQLAADKPIIRTAAAEGLGMIGEPGAVKDLGTRLGTEDDATVIAAILRSIDLLKSGDAGKSVKEDDLRAAVIEATRIPARCKEWHGQLAAINFLHKFRYLESIPVLIDVLERYAANDKAQEPDRVHPGVRFRAHEVLVALTGAFHAIDDVDKWRQFWQRERGTLKVVRDKDKAAKAANSTGAVKFFDIPVRGKRVIFVIDISGSMDWETWESGTTANQDRGKFSGARLKLAKKQLLGAVDPLPEETQFNVICYSTKFEAWKPKLVPATKANKAAFTKWLEKLRADGGTNIFDAMQEALKMKSLVYGSRYDSSVDEVFLMSDGEPTFGKVVDAAEVEKLLTETNRYSGVRINTVFVDGPEPEAARQARARSPFKQPITGKQLMERLAKNNGGIFVPAGGTPRK